MCLRLFCLFAAPSHNPAPLVYINSLSTMYLISLFRQYLSGSAANGALITAANIAQVKGTFPFPRFTADIIFSETDTKLYQSYLVQLDIRSSEAPTPYAPTPYGYNDFLLWQSPTPPGAHRPCQHPRHPSNKLKLFHKHCPECVWKIYASYLDLIADRWKEQGGPARPTPTKRNGSKLDQYQTLKKAWCYARLAMANLESMFELMLVQERLWCERHSRRSSAGTESVIKALETAQNSAYGPPETSPSHSPHEHPLNVASPGKKAKTRKTVAFAADTKKTAGGRQREKYQRHHKLYRPGRHACPSALGWLNTSSKNEWRSSIAQCKLFIVEKSKDMEADKPESRIRQGLVSHYPHRMEVMEFLQNRLENDEFVSREQYLRMLNRCDGVVVLKPQAVKELGAEGVVIEDARLLFLVTDGHAVKSSACSDQVQMADVVTQEQQYPAAEAEPPEVGKGIIDWVSVSESLESEEQEAVDRTLPEVAP
ncbi:hypothetical protein HBH98_071550 [Parastagonospora nodorum]|nr:hypothetical protein HBH53_020430 [Parastagonospora nodorum]KAH3968193.1 hypothetical protein HBH51_133020 [Parastagonospora nodorum]KAH3999884.1 hypothetical protein HBI10_106920 [Parastagonospora nodorum]KAH4022411.1 hypothetical protein HBI13_102270 [Parastagonospora nodorum]KAH4027579.1 hypothetical protein HBI09_140550 [Parastagonospora nodorum]